MIFFDKKLPCLFHKKNPNHETSSSCKYFTQTWIRKNHHSYLDFALEKWLLHWMWSFGRRNQIKHIDFGTPTWLEWNSHRSRSSQSDAMFVSLPKIFVWLHFSMKLITFASLVKNTVNLGSFLHAFPRKNPPCLSNIELGET